MKKNNIIHYNNNEFEVFDILFDLEKKQIPRFMKKNQVSVRNYKYIFNTFNVPQDRMLHTIQFFFVEHCYNSQACESIQFIYANKINIFRPNAR